VARRTFEPSQIGRWPANVLHDGSDEATEGLRDAARYFYTAKADRSDREEVIGDLTRRTGADAVGREDGSAGMQSPRAGAGRTARDLVNHHPTVKPTDLMRYLVRMVTPPGGLVLDPFTGSGSTGRAAMLEGMRFVGCELSREYAEIARARIRFTLGPLFAHLVE
jgi:site-specific DNA-methyltransferase (adenine-specific)